MKRLILGLVAAAVLALPIAATAAPEPVMTGLYNPRGLGGGPRGSGAPYVAEAGKGGPGVCVPLPDGPGVRCYGATGAISRLWHGQQERIATGLPSLGGQPAGDTATGPQHISFQGRGGLYLTIGCVWNKATPTGAASRQPGLRRPRRRCRRRWSPMALDRPRRLRGLGQSGRHADRQQPVRAARPARPPARDGRGRQLAARRRGQRRRDRLIAIFPRVAPQAVRAA